jgi:hypothetical protein
MSNLVDWPMDWMALLKFWLSSYIQVALNSEDLARNFACKWEVKMIFPAPNVKLLFVSAYFYILATVLLPTAHGRLLSTIVRLPS